MAHESTVSNSSEPEDYSVRPDMHIFLQKYPEKRRAHVLAVTEFAAELAEIHGADIEATEAAALLHDITKSYEFEAQLKLCEKYGTIMTDSDLACPGTLHALTGAAVANAEYGATDAVCSAIRRHSTGGTDMSKLEKIIYIADKCDTSRTYQCAAEIRTIARRSLDEGLKAAMQRSMEHLVEKGRTVHPETLRAYEEMTKEGIR